jgi:hypothetical protein
MSGKHRQDALRAKDMPLRLSPSAMTTFRRRGYQIHAEPALLTFMHPSSAV